MFGINVSYENIKSKIKIDNQGVSAYEIVRVAKEYGVKAIGYKNYFLKNTLNFPFIAHTVNNNIQHFVVVLKITNNKVKISDPSRGILYLNKDEFKKIYTGISIVFNNDNSLSIKKEVLNKKFVILITSLILFLSILNIFYSYLLSFVIESFKNSNKIIVILVMLFTIGILKEMIDFIKERVLLKYQIMTDRAITIPTLKRIINLPHVFYHKKSAGELISKINDLSYIKQMAYASVQILFVNVIIIFISFIFLLYVNIATFFLNLAVTFLIIFYSSLFYKNNLYKNYDLQIKNEALNTKISDGINSMINIKNLCKENYLEDKIITSYNETIEGYKKLSLLYQNKNMIYKILILISLILSIYILIKTDISISSLLFVTYLESIIYDSIGAVCSLIGMYSDFKSSYVRIKDLYKEKQIDNRLSLIDVNNIIFKNVSYSYNKKVIFKNVNLKITKNDFIMINGPSGSGKTTLFKMLTSEIKSDGKNIFINKKSINSYTSGQLRKSITYADQKVRLLSDTVLENITFGSKMNLRKNFKKVLDEILGKRNIKYDTIIDNTSSNLSGGELSLVFIAQILNNSGNVIIFDETTSQMDAFLERKILKAIKEDYKDKIIILITHRLSNQDLFDKIVNL